ncbi:TraB/GumN family protein [Lutispora thermophila]|uniref:SLH domain-containing protein n=1 Tax=Lutispora thermophila DSM 19022 TaxID=1122184 RepID=A0A1M6DSA2_9FIRM|nr:TraB/GumN family protein [Lutispora thermophila]SHI76055.1 hypothetical protein SAMN02745176_01260 [Lutispora thermophila DSM 19022]
MKKLKKLAASLIVFLLLFQLLQLPTINVWAIKNEIDKSDAPSNWAAEHVQMAKLYKLADESMFSNFHQNATRKDLAKIGIALYEKLTEKTTGNDEAILKAYELGLMQKYSDDKLEPEKPITRGEAILLLHNVIKSCEPEFNYEVDIDLKYKDVDSLEEPYLSAARYAVAKNLLKGTNESKLALADNCTRQELIILANKYYEFAIREGNKASKGLMWKISNGKNHLYVLGSIHIADISIYPFGRNIMEAYYKSDYLAVEANIVPSNEDIMYMLQKAFYQDGNSIDKNISEETYKKYTEFMDSYAGTLGIGPEAYNLFKPWYVTLLLPNLTLAQNSFDAALGIDMYFVNKAMGIKDIIEIEGIKFQVDMFDNFSPELQERLLISSLTEMETAKEDNNTTLESMKNMLTAWKKGDAAALEAILEISKQSDADKLSDEFVNKFWHDRDKHMADTIKKFLADENGKTYFVVVGAGHLVGDKGVIKILENDGYDIEQILN